MKNIDHIKYVKYLIKTKNSKNIPLSFLSFHFSSRQSTMTSHTGGSRQLKSHSHRSKNLHPNPGMYLLFTYILFRSKHYQDRLKEKKAKMLEKCPQKMMSQSIAHSKKIFRCIHIVCSLKISCSP